MVNFLYIYLGYCLVKIFARLYALTKTYPRVVPPITAEVDVTLLAIRLAILLWVLYLLATEGGLL